MQANVRGLAAFAMTLPILVACHSTPEAPPAAASRPPEPPVQTSQGAPAPKLDPAIEARARSALSQAGITGELRLVSAESVQWSDSSLGCRQPGQQYLQVITPGYRLQFGSGERKAATYEVHVAGETAIVCSPELGTGVVQRAPMASRARNMDVVIEAATQDIARRLGLKRENVQLRNMSPARFDDNQLGCGAPANESQSPPVAGYKLLFSTTVGMFIYHADNERAVPCPPIAAE